VGVGMSCVWHTVVEPHGILVRLVTSTPTLLSATVASGLEGERSGSLAALIKHVTEQGGNRENLRLTRLRR
jgi:hypothetical protein